LEKHLDRVIYFERIPRQSLKPQMNTTARRSVLLLWDLQTSLSQTIFRQTVVFLHSTNCLSENCLMKTGFRRTVFWH